MTGSEPSDDSVPLYHYKELPKELRAKIDASMTEGKKMSRAQQAAIAISKKERGEYKEAEELEKDEDDPCWKGYVQVGMKKKNGKEVPNCVPMSELVEGDKWTDKQAEREHSKLFLKALKTMPGSPKQKEIIKQMNVLRKDNGLAPLEEKIDMATSQKNAEKSLSKKFKQSYTAEQRLLQLGEVTSNFLPQIDDLDGDGIPDDPYFNTQTRLVPFEVKIEGFPSFILWSVSISKVRSAIRGTLKRLDDIEYIERITDVEARAVHKRRYDQFNRNPLRTRETGKKVGDTDLDQAYLSRQDAYYRESYERGTDELVKAYKKATPGELEEAPQWVKELIAKYFKQNKYEKAAQGLIRYMDKMSDADKKRHGVDFYAGEIIRISNIDLDARILAKTAKKILATEAIFYAKRTKKSLHEIYRPHSEMYYELFETARELGAIVEGADKYLLEDTDIGEFSRYQGKMVPLDIPLIEETDVELNSPKRGGSKKFYVYVKNDKGNVVKVSFGDDTGLQAKINDAEATKSFVARHDCANKKDKTTRLLGVSFTNVRQGTWTRRWRRLLLVNPYTDEKEFRTFSCNVDDNELVWHRDKTDRIVTVVEGEGWQYQTDNDLPIELKEGDTLFIPAMTYHRILKGKSDLKIKIKENLDV